MIIEDVVGLFKLFSQVHSGLIASIRTIFLVIAYVKVGEILVVLGMYSENIFLFHKYVNIVLLKNNVSLNRHRVHLW